VSKGSFLQAVFREFPEALILVGEHGKIVSMNSACSDLTGYSEEELLGKEVTSLFSVADASLAWPARSERWDGEVVWSPAEGESVSMYLVVWPISESETGNTGYTFLLRPFDKHRLSPGEGHMGHKEKLESLLQEGWTVQSITANHGKSYNDFLVSLEK